MELNTDSYRTTKAMGYDLCTALIDPRRDLDRFAPGALAKSRPNETAKRVPAVTTAKEEVPAFMHSVREKNTVLCAGTHRKIVYPAQPLKKGVPSFMQRVLEGTSLFVLEHIAGTIIENDFDHTEHRPQLLSKTVS